MGKNKYKKQIGRFSEFCKQKQSIKENSQVQIDVPFWNEAIEYALSDIRSLAGGGSPIDWDRMVEQIKMRFSMLNIYDKSLFTDDSFVLAYVKDILYHNYKDSFISGDIGGADSYGTEEMGTKALVLSKLADTVLQKVRVEAGLDKEPEPEKSETVATVSLEAGFLDDDCLQYEQRSVARFNGFTHLLKESINRLRIRHGEKALDYCLDKLKASVGSIKQDDVMKAVKKEQTTLTEYLSEIVDEYMQTARIELNGAKLKDSGNQRNVLKPAKKLFAQEIVRKLIAKIKNETR